MITFFLLNCEFDSSNMKSGCISATRRFTNNTTDFPVSIKLRRTLTNWNLKNANNMSLSRYQIILKQNKFIYGSFI